MQQTFLGFVTSDTRFWVASTTAIFRSLLVPLALMSVAFGAAFGPNAAGLVFLSAVIFAAFDWLFLIVRMARRIALGLEAPNDLLDRTVLGNASYLYRAYYAGPMPRVETARG